MQRRTPTGKDTGTGEPSRVAALEPVNSDSSQGAKLGGSGGRGRRGGRGRGRGYTRHPKAPPDTCLACHYRELGVPGGGAHKRDATCKLC